ncbi:ROK family transcriptional regulator [Rhodococcus sp. T7]|uniref:ROK family transcriptional regulator n=1 Tax=Rhodococcus sp. T7 TaxID=627444 RepID=UPI00135939E3|nr:ROK family transcriptional regulator [Rhodococcus sp. T7]KAF0965295.1 N-acetylglucosamine repressor [Rhodococcus sp. T7]
MNTSWRPQGNSIDSASAGGLLEHIRRRQGAATRAEMARLTGVARSTIAQRIDQLIDAGLVVEGGDAPSTGGRRGTTLSLCASAGVVLAADLGVTHCRWSIADLAGTPLLAQTRDIDIADGPLVVLDQLIQDFDASLTQLGFTAADVCGVGVGVPGPVEVDTGRAVNPPIMPGWNEFSVTDYLRRHYDAPAYLDNDVNIMAIGEYAMHFADEVDDFLLIKVGSGIGSGIIAGRQLQRGGKGAAGDLGHVPVGRAADVPCRCGNSGCVEAVAGGAAILRQLRELGHEAVTVRDAATMVSAGHSDANRLVRQAGRDLGEVVATTVNILNPSLIVLSGALADAGDELYAGVREVVYRRSTVLATRHLRIVHGRLGADAGIVGATELVLSEVLSAKAVDAALAAGTSPVGRARQDRNEVPGVP